MIYMRNTKIILYNIFINKWKTPNRRQLPFKTETVTQDSLNSLITTAKNEEWQVKITGIIF